MQPPLAGPQNQLVSNPYAPRPGEHPLMPALRWAIDGKQNIDKIQDYSATLIKRESVDGTITEQAMFVKVRHQPFSVYAYFLGPNDVKGREVIYIKGQNNGNIWAHTTGVQDKLVGTVSLPPTGMIAMYGQRYPITEIGLANLVTRLIQVGEADSKYGECDVQYFSGAKVSAKIGDAVVDRVCTCIQVVHPFARRNFLFHMARIYVDDELNLPIRYEAHAWPDKPGGPMPLIEEYTYLDLKLNNGFTDRDFDVTNKDYSFR